MAIDASIYSEFIQRLPKLATLGEIAERREQREDRRQIRQQQQQALDLRQKAMDDAQADEQAVTEAFRVNTGPDGPNFKKAIAQLYTTRPNAAAKIDKAYTEQLKTASEQRKLELDNENAELTGVSQLLSGVNERTYGWLFPVLKQRAPDVANALGPQYDKDKIEVLISAGQKAAERNTRVKSVLDQEAAAEQKALNLISLAENDDHMADAWDFAKANGVADDLRQAGIGDKWSPEQSARAGQLTISPEKRADDARMAAGQAQQAASTAASQAETARHNVETEKLGRGSLAVAQGNLALRKQEAAASGGSPEGLAPMVEAIMANPSIYAGLTPTAKEKLIVPLQAKGFDFKASTGLTPSMQAGVSRLTTSLKMLQQLDADLTQQTGMRGKAAGATQSVWAWLSGEDTPASLYGGIADSLLPALARSSGEVGNLAEQEQKRYARLAPKVADPLNIRRAKYAAIQYIIDAANQGKTAAEMAPFLDYMKFAGTPPAVSAAPATRANPFRK